MSEDADEQTVEADEGHEFLTPPPDEAEGSDDGGDTSFALLALALLVLVGGSVYFVGKLMSANEQTEVAQERAEQVIAEFDPEEFVSEFTEEDLAPSSLPLVDEAEDDAVVEPAPTTSTIPPEIIDPEDIGIAFVNRVPGDEYAHAAYIDTSGERHVTDIECDRLDRNDAGGICLSATAGIRGSGRAFLMDSALTPTSRFGVNKPSRAAVSPDGEVVAWTGFTLGHSYLADGEFATKTQLIDVERGIAADLERVFATYDLEGDIVDAPDRNFWGVSFVDRDHFYATISTGGVTSIVEGRVSTSRIDIIHADASCPEISPDGSTLVVKERRGDLFQLVAIDVESGARRDLGESRSVDDQVEWFGDDTILYGIVNPDEGTDAQPVLDIYALEVAPGSSPRLLIPFADSPAA